MATGTVKWFNNAKGYGFILPADSEEDVFAHYSAITMDGYRTLKAGQQVTFELVDGDKGKHAANISLCSENTPPSEDSPDAVSDPAEQVPDTAPDSEAEISATET